MDKDYSKYLKKKIDVSAITDQVIDIMKKMDMPDFGSMGLSEDIRNRLENAGPRELERIEKELGLSLDDEMMQKVNEKVVEAEYELSNEDSEIDKAKQNVPTLQEENVDGFFEIKIAEDQMSASISLSPSKGLDLSLNIEKVKESLLAMNVVYGVGYDLLKKLIDDVENSHTEKSDVIFAQGTLPNEGQDGSIEYSFSEDEDILRRQEEYMD